MSRLASTQSSRPGVWGEPGAGPVAVIAGGGDLPREAARLLSNPFAQSSAASRPVASAERRVLGIGFDDITDANFKEVVDTYLSLPLGQLEALLGRLRGEECHRLLLAGKFEKGLLSGSDQRLQPDTRAFSLLGEMSSLADDGVMAIVAHFLEAEGFTLLDQQCVLAPLLVAPGSLTAALPSEAALRDVGAARTLHASWGGAVNAQCLVMKEGELVFAEDDGGTDDAIRQAGSLAGAGTTVVKTLRAGQDTRFDLPTIGPQTVAAMREVSATTLAVEAGASLIANREECVAEAERAGIVLFGFVRGGARAVS